MTSRFEARITVDAGENTGAVFESVNTDNEFYPENPTKTSMALAGGNIAILIESDHLPHFRANLNSTLRLIQASHDSIESVKGRQ